VRCCASKLNIPINFLLTQSRRNMASMFRSGHKAKSQRNGYGLDEPAGVGIVFKSGPDEALFVKVCAGSLCVFVGAAEVNGVLWAHY
jgi:hypothetical protein